MNSVNETKIKRIQISNNLLKDKNISHEAIYLLIYLKNVCINNHVKIYSQKLLTILNWKDTRTLKKYLKQLYDIKQIDTYYEKIPKHKPIELNITSMKGIKDFTQIDIDTIQKIKEITKEVLLPDRTTNMQEKAIRLFYIYEMYYNDEVGKSFPQYTDISKAGISSRDISILNRILEEKKLLKIEHGSWYEKEEDGILKRRKGRNYYVPKCKRKKKKI